MCFLTCFVDLTHVVPLFGIIPTQWRNGVSLRWSVLHVMSKPHVSKNVNEDYFRTQDLENWGTLFDTSQGLILRIIKFLSDFQNTITLILTVFFLVKFICFVHYIKYDLAKQGCKIVVSFLHHSCLSSRQCERLSKTRYNLLGYICEVMWLAEWFLGLKVQLIALNFLIQVTITILS